MILDTAAVPVRDPQRFAQTGVGGTTRSLSDACPDQAFQFLQKSKDQMSVEGVRMATARLRDSNRFALGVAGKRKRR